MSLRIFADCFMIQMGGAGGIPVSGLALGTLRRGRISNLFCSGVFSRNMASAVFKISHRIWGQRGAAAFCLGQIYRGGVRSHFGAKGWEGAGEGYGTSSVRRKVFWAFCNKYSWS